MGVLIKMKYAAIIAYKKSSSFKTTLNRNCKEKEPDDDFLGLWVQDRVNPIMADSKASLYNGNTIDKGNIQ